MGYWSDKQIEQVERGVNVSRLESRHVCESCFADDALKEFTRTNSSAQPCDYCDGLRSASLADVVVYINACLESEWGDAFQLLPVDDETGDVMQIAQIHSTRDLLGAEIGLDLPNDQSGRLFEEIISALPDQLWCHGDPLASSPIEGITSSWQLLCQIIKHERRFFFLQDRGEKDFQRMMDEEATYNTAEILSNVFGYCDRAGMFKTIGAGAKYFRCQVKNVADPAFGPRRMGPAPNNKALQSNRMSPAGVPMFYGAEDATVALAETTTSAGHFAVGQFVTLRDIMLLDLRNPPRIPSFFDLAASADRKWATFMTEFVGEFKRPVVRDGAEHVDYVPTQVATEYVRTLVKSSNTTIDGILYSSTRRPGGTAVVLFADTFAVENVAPSSDLEKIRLKMEQDKYGVPWLRMIDCTEMDFTP